MNNLNEENMAEFVVEALERTAFVLADIVDAEYATQELPPPDRYARIAFHRGRRGRGMSSFLPAPASSSNSPPACWESNRNR